MMVTLQSLREEFEAARDAFLNEEGFVFRAGRWRGGDAPGSIMTNRTMFPQIVDNTVEQWANANPYFDCQDAREAARRYVIARDFREFDPKRADMLWKLQNGGAL